MEENLNKLIHQAGFKKRIGLSVTDAVFCRQSLETFSGAKKDVMYDLLKREDVDMASSRLKVYVLDDSIKGRRGKKMEGVS